MRIKISDIGRAREIFVFFAKKEKFLNFFKELLEMFYPRCKENGRIVLMSSYCSQSTQFRFKPNSFANPMSKELYLVNSGLSRDKMKELALQFVADCKGHVENS